MTQSPRWLSRSISQYIVLLWTNPLGSQTIGKCSRDLTVNMTVNGFQKFKNSNFRKHDRDIRLTYEIDFSVHSDDMAKPSWFPDDWELFQMFWTLIWPLTAFKNSKIQISVNTTGISTGTPTWLLTSISRYTVCIWTSPHGVWQIGKRFKVMYR